MDGTTQSSLLNAESLRAARARRRRRAACEVGALSMLFGCKLMAPHGGLFVLLIPGAVSHALAYLAAIAAGSLLAGLAYAVIKKNSNEAVAEAGEETGAAQRT